MEGWIQGTNCYHATQCDVGVSLHSRTHPLFMWHNNGSVIYTGIRAFRCFFYNPYMSLFNF